MVTTGPGTPSAKGPNEDQAGVSVTAGGSLPAGGQDMGATARVGGAAGAEGAREAQEKSHQEQDEAQRATLLEEAGQAAAKLRGLMAKLAGTWQTPLADTETQVMALAARLVPAAECLWTAEENLMLPDGQPDSAREQMLQAEAHLSFAWLHMAAAQRSQAPAEETRTTSNAPSIHAEVQLERALTEVQSFVATISASQSELTREALRRTACVLYVAGEACEVAVRTSWNPRDAG
jgi:hypothetical protein